MLFDSHAHLDDEAFREDREKVIAALGENGIDYMINIGSSIKTSRFSLDLAEKYPFIHAAVGVHPSETAEMKKSDIDLLEEMAKAEKCVAIGEIGLDYYYDTPDRTIQRLWFEEQCKLAKKLDMPVIIHDRDAHEESFEIVKKYGNRGVFHCFSSSAEMAKRLCDLGFYISFTGVLTFKNAKKAVEAAAAVPLDRILIETDCPYMAPEPLRGSRNEPKNVYYTAVKLAEIKGLSFEETAKITTENALRLFNIGGKNV